MPLPMRKLRTIEMNRLSIEEFKEAEKLPLVVVLDDVRSLHNVGSVLRTCDAFRAEAVYMCGITATPPQPEIHKTALGAEDSVSWRYFKTAEEAVRELQANGYQVYAIEQAEGSTMLQEVRKARSQEDKKSSSFPPLGEVRRGFQGVKKSGSQGGQKYAVVLGNEVKGVHQSVVDLCDNCLEIPQYGTKHSLNVSVTAGIVVWEFFNKCSRLQANHHPEK